MDLFEILFIVLVLVLPLLQGLFQKGRKGTEEGPGRPSRTPPTARREPERPDLPQGRPAEPGPAADMVPDDLWELLTGERRERSPVSVEEPTEAEVEPWSVEPEWSPEIEEPVLEERPVWGRPVEPEADAPPVEPVSLEYLGPEAYSLETPPLPPEARHARFHEVIERSDPAAGRPVRTRRAPSLVRTLRSREGMRDAIVLAEVLGRPKGLE